MSNEQQTVTLNVEFPVTWFKASMFKGCKTPEDSAEVANGIFDVIASTHIKTLKKRTRARKKENGEAGTGVPPTQEQHA